MQIRDLHSWDITPREALRLQARLARRVRLVALPSRIHIVAGADCALSPDRSRVMAVVAVFRLPGFRVIERVDGEAPAAFPYVPGLLSFREAPALLDAFRRLEVRPEAVLFDGQGYAHPRRLGLAAHLGLWLDLPTVGCAKSRLIGEAAVPRASRGSYRTLLDREEPVGRVLRTRDRVKPLFVSPGHLCDIEGASRLTLRCCRGFRLPEPTRYADREVGLATKGIQSPSP